MNDKEQGALMSEESAAPNVFCPDQLVERCLGNLDFAQRVLDLFLNNVDRDIETLIDANRQNDHERLARSAHKLKGCAASIAAPRLRGVMVEVEEASRSEAEGNTDSLLSQVQQETQALKEALACWRDSVSGRADSSNTSLPLIAEKTWRGAVP